MIKARLMTVTLALLLGLACGDDVDKPSDGSTTDATADAGGGDLHANLKIKSITPETATLIVNMLQDIKVELNRPPQSDTFVDVISADPAKIEVVHAALKFSGYTTEATTTIQAKQLTNGAEVDVMLKLRGTNETATFKAKVQKILPDAGVSD